MQVWIGFRRLQTKDFARSRLARWSVEYTQPLDFEEGPPVHLPRDVCHVEIVVEVVCSGVDTCVYCRRLAQYRDTALQKGELKRQQQYTVDADMHLISYSITGVPPHDKVFCAFNRKYPPREWLFYSTTLRIRPYRALLKFLQQQLDKPFARMAFYLNFAPKHWWLWGCGRESSQPTRALRWWQRGCAWSEHGQHYAEHAQWFCSELVVAALQPTGLCPGVAPSTVSPNHLLWCTASAPAWTATTAPVSVPYQV